MKRLLSVLLCAVMLLSLCALSGCGSSKTLTLTNLIDSDTDKAVREARKKKKAMKKANA